MDEKTLADKVLSLEKDIIILEKNQNRIIKETKEGFSELTKIVENLSSTLLENMESDNEEHNLVEEYEERLTEIEDNFEEFQEEITNKLAHGTDMSIEEIEKAVFSLLDAIKDNRDAINGIIKYIKKKEDGTGWDLLVSLTNLRGLIGIP